MSAPAPKIVVVIDDDASMRRVLGRVLAWRGYTAVTAADAPTGLALVLEHAPVVVTVDFDLGAGNGAQVAESIAAALGERAPPVVLVSAMADRLSRSERRRFAAIHLKPFRASELLDDVDRLARRGTAEPTRSGVRAMRPAIARDRAENE